MDAVNEGKLPALSEADWQRKVLEAAGYYGWMVAHFRAAQTQIGWRTPVAANGKGFPDLVLVHPRGGVLFRELKSEKGRLSPEQVQWSVCLELAGANYAVWRPSDWPAVQIELARKLS